LKVDEGFVVPRVCAHFEANHNRFK